MTSESDPAVRRQRETFLTIFLCILVLGGGLVLMIGMMGMFVLHAITVMTMMVCFGLFHYLLWGRSMTQQVEAEREEQEGFRALDETPPSDDSIQARRY